MNRIDDTGTGKGGSLQIHTSVVDFFYAAPKSRAVPSPGNCFGCYLLQVQKG